jgi:hypothetical protein
MQSLEGDLADIGYNQFRRQLKHRSDIQATFGRK